MDVQALAGPVMTDVRTTEDSEDRAGLPYTASHRLLFSVLQQLRLLCTVGKELERRIA